MIKIKKILAIVFILSLSFCLLCACDKKKSKEDKTETTQEELTTHEPQNVLMEVAADDNFRHAFRDAFDTFNDGSGVGSMNYDYRDENSVKTLLSCMYGPKACVNYSLYPVEQPTDNGINVTLSAESLKWVAMNIFHADEKIVDNFIKNCPDCSNGMFTKEYEKDENGAVWYYSSTLVKEATEDGLYYYVQMNRIHNDPSEVGRNGGSFTQDYYGVFASEEIDGETYWTMYTYGSSGYNRLIKDPNLEPDTYFATEKQMITVADGIIMRAGPGKEYKAVCSYNGNIIMMAIGTKGEWIYCHYYDGYGWIHNSLLEDYK